MTPAQIALMKDLIESDRRYRRGIYNKDNVWNDLRGVEISSITGYSLRTAKALDEAGLIELVCLHGRQTYAFLGKYDPYLDEPAPIDLN